MKYLALRFETITAFEYAAISEHILSSTNVSFIADLA
jgi:hypothetical protein